MRADPAGPPADHHRPYLSTGHTGRQPRTARPVPDGRANTGARHIKKRARKLITADQNAAAANLMIAFLARLDPVTARADPHLIDLIQMFLGHHDYLTYLGNTAPTAADKDRRLGWSRYALRATEHHFGTHHPRWLPVAHRHAHVLAQQGLTGDAVTVQRRRLEVAKNRNDPQTVTSTWRALGYALHADGQCDAAHDEMDAALQSWHANPDPALRFGPYLLHAALLLLVSCEQRKRATHLLDRYTHLIGEPGSDVRVENIRCALLPLASKVQRHHPLVCPLHPRTPVRLPPIDHRTTGLCVDRAAHRQPHPPTARRGRRAPGHTMTRALTSANTGQPTATGRTSGQPATGPQQEPMTTRLRPAAPDRRPPVAAVPPGRILLLPAITSATLMLAFGSWALLLWWFLLTAPATTPDGRAYTALIAGSVTAATLTYGLAFTALLATDLGHGRGWPPIVFAAAGAHLAGAVLILADTAVTGADTALPGTLFVLAASNLLFAAGIRSTAVRHRAAVHAAAVSAGPGRRLGPAAIPAAGDVRHGGWKDLLPSHPKPAPGTDGPTSRYPAARGAGSDHLADGDQQHAPRPADPGP